MVAVVRKWSVAVMGPGVRGQSGRSMAMVGKRWTSAAGGREVHGKVSWTFDHAVSTFWGQEDFHFGSRAARRSDVLISLSTYKHTKK